MRRTLDLRDKNIYKNSVLSVVYKFVSMGVSLVSAPLMLACLGQEKYGIWASLLSIVSWVYYFDLGIGNGLRNKLAASIAQGDEKRSRKLLSVSYVLVSIMATAIFVIACGVLHIVDIGDILEIQLDGENVNTVVLCAILFACINFVASLANNVLYALQRASAVSFFGVIGQVLFVIAMAIYLVTGQQLLMAVAVSEGISQLLKNIVETVWVYRKNKNIRFSLKKLDFSYSKGIMTFGVQMFVMQMAALVLNTTDNIIITKYFGPAEVTPYNFCYKYFNMINSVFVALITPLLSAYTAAYAKKDTLWIKKSFKKSCFLYFVFCFGTVLSGFAFKPFANVWLQKELVYQQGLIFFTGLYFIVLMCSHVFSTFLTGVGTIGETTFAMIVQAIVNVPVSIILATQFGMRVNGVIWGSVISVSIGLAFGVIKTFFVMRGLKED